MGRLRRWLNRRVTSEYHFAPGLLVRALGLLLACLGLFLLVVAFVVAALDVPRAAMTGALLVALAITAVVAATGLLVARRTSVVRLDETGYRVRLVRGAGAKQARWRDVDDLVTADVRGTRGVVLRLRDGATTTVPVAVLDADPERFVEDLRGHLDRAHGYRRLR